MPRIPPFTFRGFSSLLISTPHEVRPQSPRGSSQKKYFRLLYLDDLTLRTFEIGSFPPYVAISHVWADNVFIDLLQFDASLGGRAVRIALHERFPGVKYCWIDNFCILQDNENDKLEQIPFMGDIYCGADAVLIIHACELGLTQVELDEATLGVEAAIELWRAGTPYYAEEYRFWKAGEGYERIVRAIEALARFTQSDWCTRVWTLQEFIFARTIVWIGADLIPLACEETLFTAIPNLCNSMQLKELNWQIPDLGFNRLHWQFDGMADMRIAGHNLTEVMGIAASRKSSILVDEIYGAMAASGVQIFPLPNETKEDAWMRWCEAAVIKGHIQWLMRPPATSSISPTAPQRNCLFPTSNKRGNLSSPARLKNVVPYAPPSISAGTVTLYAKYVGRCKLLRKLGPMSRRGGLVFPIHSFIIFSKKDWSLAAHIVESFSPGQFPRDRIHAVANIFANSYESAVQWWNEDLGDFSPVISSPLEEEAYLAFSAYLTDVIISVLDGSTTYLALLEDEELQLSHLVAVAITDRVPTGSLIAFDVNAITDDQRTILMIAEAAVEHVQRQQEDPEFEPEDFVFHKAGVTIPLRANINTALQLINVGGSRCPVCRSEE